MEKFIKQTECESKMFPNLLGKSHRYKTDKGEISCIHPCMATMGCYEIYCIEGDLFEDIERYDTLEESETRISELLN